MWAAEGHLQPDPEVKWNVLSQPRNGSSHTCTPPLKCQCRKPFPWTGIKASVFLGSVPGSQTPLSRSQTFQGNQRNALDSNALGWQYYEMLYNTADELLNLVVDQGVKYTELEYIYALNLLHRSQTGVGDQTTQNMRLQRLKEIICEQAAIKQATKDKKITTV
ncbi:hypothetical protein DUI87_13354 [Hirundo rustica rustica]|uniref:Exocyst complex component Sec8 n=1 Tax=Hirundo rustica rustica TaxID=333673 RepID=A0A3M0KBI3_HIRRU|nr:hypothetical protein DUI87_13354 [Hirundo rustica rustica]